MKEKKVSISVIRRLPRYYRFLGMLEEQGIRRISSGELSAKMGLTASQIRQDLNCFGGFGQQGYGYNVTDLRQEIGNIIGLSVPKKTILIGAGNLGRAILSHMEFTEKGFTITAIFDQDEKLTGEVLYGLPIRPTEELEEYCRAQKPTVAILCVPKMASENLVKRLVSVGIEGFWNFSHYDIGVFYPDVAVENVHLGDSLMTLCYEIKSLEEKQNQKTSEA